MKKFTYKVVFKNKQELMVYASSVDTATILAQAEAIKDGFDYIVDHITRVD